MQKISVGRKSGYLGIVSKVQGPLSILILLDDVRVVRRHVDHVKVRETALEQLLGPEDPEMLDLQRTNNNPFRLIEELDI